MSSRHRCLVILTLIACLVLAALTAIDILYVDEAINSDPATDHTDSELYIQRAETILAGKLLYRDVETQTPPLINYLLVPPVYMGASPLAFELYFSMFIVMTVLMLFWVLSRVDEKLAFRASLAFLLIPTTLITPTFARQDEVVVVFFMMLPLLAVSISHNEKTFAALAALGIWIKMHSIFLILPLLIKSSLKQKLQELAIMAIVTLAITIPFFVLAFDEFTWHLRFYFLGEDDHALQGISLWRILDAEGMGVPSLLLIGIMGVAILIIYWWSWRHEVDIWRTVSLTLIIYFIIYPKVHYEYFVILFAILTPLLIESKKAIAMLYGVALLSGCTLLIEQRYLDWGVATDQYGLMISLAALCMVSIDIILLFFFKDLLTKKTWLDRRPRPLF